MGYFGVLVAIVALAVVACGGDDSSGGGSGSGAAAGIGGGAGGSGVGGGSGGGGGGGQGGASGGDGGTPEICDGVDNDGNGVVDDALTDTPPACPAGPGVCSSGAQASCAGAAGWQCTFTAAGYETLESACDGVDNDCDGAVDEACTTCSSADRLWMASSSYDPISFQTQYSIRWIPPGATSGAVTIASGLGAADAVRADAVHSKVYWVESGLRRADFDGQNKEQLGSAATLALSVHPSGDWIYWGGISTIQRAAPSALASPETVVSGGTYIAHVVAVGAYLYWSDNPGIHRANLDGTQPQTLLPSAVAWALAVDVVANRLYWVEAGDPPVIWRADLDGSNAKTLATMTGIHKVADMVVDASAKHIYIAAEGFMAELDTDGSDLKLPASGGNATMDSIDLSGCNAP